MFTASRTAVSRWWTPSTPTFTNARCGCIENLVEKGQLVGTMGGNNGMYFVHLHFEMRKNLHIGMNRSSFARDSSNYYSPTAFINAHRALSSSAQKIRRAGQQLRPLRPLPGRCGQWRFALRRSCGARFSASSAVGGGNAAAKPSDDCWSRLKTKMRGGEVVPANEDRR